MTFQVLLTHDPSTLETKCRDQILVAVGPAVTGTIAENDDESRESISCRRASHFTRP